MTEKVALITGITGQDGAYLARLLLNNGYLVHGIRRRTASANTYRIDGLFNEPAKESDRLILHYGDMTDTPGLFDIVKKVQPDEIYNLAAQSHVGASFKNAEFTSNTDALGVLRLLEAIKLLDLSSKTKFYQASTSELYGDTPIFPQNENTPFQPRSPYGVAKLYAYWITVNYRQAYGIHASNGILFNHESPMRGEDFVTRKITKSVAKVSNGSQEVLALGNLNARRDWGHARDYVDAMWRILQQDSPDDYVISSGKMHTVREFVEAAFKHIGVALDWKGDGIEEKGYDKHSGRLLVVVDPQYFRPTDVEFLCGDFTKAKEKLSWEPTTTFDFYLIG